MKPQIDTDESHTQLAWNAFGSGLDCHTLRFMCGFEE